MLKGDFVCISGGKTDKIGRKINEDKVVIGTNYAILMDGATGLSDFQFENYLTNAEWYVKYASEFIKEKLEKEPRADLKNVVIECVKYMKEEIEKLEEKANYKLKSYEEPSSSIIILREIDGMTDIFSLGDSITAIKMTNGEVKILRDEKLVALDNIVLNRMAEIAKKEGKDVIEIRNYEEICQMLRANREKKNSNLPDAYWILGTDLTAIEHAKILKMQSEDIKKIICMSDGFNYNLLGMDEKEFLEKCNGENIVEYAKKSVEAEGKDEGCNKSHRFKKHDDLSGFVWEPEIE